MHKKVVLDVHCVKQAIKNIYSNNYYILPKRAGGDEGEEGSKEERHPQFLKEMIGYGWGDIGKILAISPSRIPQGEYKEKLL